MSRILIADTHEIIRSGLREALRRSDPAWQVIGEASNGKQALAKVISLMPDIALIDYALPEMDGLAVTREIRTRMPETRIMLLTSHHNEALARGALYAGARAYLLKSDSAQSLTAALRAMEQGNLFFSGDLSASLAKLIFSIQSASVSPFQVEQR